MYQSALRDKEQVERGRVEGLEVKEELLLDVPREDGPQEVHVLLLQGEAGDGVEAVGEAGEDCEIPFERIGPKADLENRLFLVHVVLPVGVAHGELVEVGREAGEMGTRWEPSGSRSCHLVADVMTSLFKINQIRSRITYWSKRSDY